MNLRWKLLSISRKGEVTLYRNLAEIQADVNVATQLLVSVFSLSEAPLIEPLRERVRGHRRPYPAKDGYSSRRPGARRA